ncbi:MAG: TSUP family transporter [Bacteroidetes bacterium]|nr:TSUP family transporter [Bacteroidota bacterium]
MEFVVIGLVALVSSLLTLFSGFGLGTLLLPAFLFFFPAPVAVAMTAIVHFMNNLFKLGLMGKYADKKVTLKFGLPALLGSAGGAFLLVFLADQPVLYSWSAGSKLFEVTALNLAMAILMLFFALWEIIPALANLTVSSRYLPVGGLLSGFFGGLSGHQGAFRSVFLVRAGLTKEAFIGTGVLIACIVDVTRLGFYFNQFSSNLFTDHTGILLTGIFSAFLGAWMGSRAIKKVTLDSVKWIVAVLLILISLLLGTGII